MKYSRSILAHDSKSLPTPFDPFTLQIRELMKHEEQPRRDQERKCKMSDSNSLTRPRRTTRARSSGVGSLSNVLSLDTTWSRGFFAQSLTDG